MRKATFAAALALGVVCIAPASANDFAPQIEQFFAKNVAPKLGEQVVISTLKRQNAQHADLTQDAIDAMDQTWRAEAKSGDGDLIRKVMSNKLSKFLSDLKASHPDAIMEVFVMDSRGLNAGQSDVTSDYNQGDESKWQKTYAAGPSARFIDDIEFDDSTERFQSQVSQTIVDPASGKPIGAITVGVNVESLL